MIALLAGLALAPQDETGYDLSIRPRYDDPVYKMHRLVLRFGAEKLEFALRVVQSVTTIGPDDETTLLFVTKRSVAWSRGRSSTTSFQKTRTMTFSKDGWQQPSFLPGEAGKSQLSSLAGFRAPGKTIPLGKSWSAATIGDPGWKTEYTLDDLAKIEGVPCLKVSAVGTTLSEDPATSMGTFFIHRETGIIFKALVKISNVRLGGKKGEATLAVEPTEPGQFEPFE